MTHPEGMKPCPTCGIPYQVNRKARHDLSSTHRSAAAGQGGRQTTRRVTTTVTTDGTPVETFGQRMARLRLEKRAQLEQSKPAGNPDPDPGDPKPPKLTRAEKRAQAVDAERSAGKRPEPDER